MKASHPIHRGRSGPVDPWRVAKRWLSRSAAMVAAVGLAGAATLPASASGATIAPRIDLKVLLLGTSTTEPDFQAWEAALKREGVRYDTVVGATHTPITSSTLAGTLSDGTLEAKYDAVIVSVGNLIDCSTATCVSDLSAAESAALEQYEHKFNIRQITGDVYPGTGFGMNPPTVSGALDGAAGTLTTDGQKVFPYLKASAPITMDTGTYGYEATPVSTTNFTTLVSGPGGSSLAGIYTHPDGVQEMVETYAQNQYQLQDELLRHGAIAWATRGVYFGDQRNYLETNIDDNFLSDDSWSVAGNATTAPHSTDFNAADASRTVPADVTTAANWSRANNFRIDMLFNGGGSVAVAAGGSIVGTGDGGSGTTGSSGTTGTGGSGSDPLLGQYTSTDPSTGKPYTGDFGWISHTWDHPNIDQGCATQNYIDAELNQNTNWGTKSAASGGLGLTASTDPTAALGNDNPQVVVTGEHSGLANLLPGNPGQVDPPSLDGATPGTTAGTFGSTGPATGQYVYAITDQFNTAAPGATPVPGTGQSAASVSEPVTVAAGKSVDLSWGAVCHAADYIVYRAPWTPTSAGATTGTIGAWSQIGTVAADTAKDFANPASTTDVTGGGSVTKTFTDTGLAGTATGSSGALTATSQPADAGAAVESPYEQNPVLDAAFAASLNGGIKYFGADASKPYPTPADGSFATGAYAGSQATAGATFQDAGATGIPRYPTNIYYNVSTNAQEVDEYQTLYDSAPSGNCQPIAGVTTCNPSGTAFTISQIVASVDQGMFQHMMGNDPRPHYFHQTNLMDQTTGPATAQGDGLFYETLNPLLAQYNQYFAASAPIEQPTTPQIGALLSEQATWAANTAVSGYIQGNQVTITNSGTGSTTIPLTGITTVGSAYGGMQSGWTSVPAGASTYTAATTWPVDTMAVSLAPSSITANGTSTSTVTATLNADGNPVTGDPVTITSGDSHQTVGPVTDNKNGTYTATITGSTTVGTATISANDPAVAPAATGQATLTQSTGQASNVSLSLSPATLVADGTSTTTATAAVTDGQAHPVAGDHVSFSSSDSAEKIGTVTDHGNGTYTATVTSSTTPGAATITATDSSPSPTVAGRASLSQTAPNVTVTPPPVTTPPATPPSAPPPVTAPSNLTAPIVTGTARIGAQLTASSGTWSGTAPLVYGYQWQRCSRRCTTIADATGTSYSPVAADRGDHLQVVVSASNSAGTGHASSAALGPVTAAVSSRALLMSLLVPSGRAARLPAVLRGGGYARTTIMPASGRLTLAWYAGGAHAGRLASRNLIARAGLRFRQGRVKVVIKLTAHGRAVLKATKRVKLTTTGTLTLTGWQRASGTRRFVLHM